MVSPLRKARRAAAKKLKEIAEFAGVSEATLSRIERGKQPASPVIAEKISRYLGTVSEIEILYPERFTK